MISAEKKQQKKIEIMEKCFACYCENGLRDTGIKDLAKYCGMTAPNFYSYFDNLDQLITESVEHCVIKIEKEIFEKAPKREKDIFPYIEEAINPTKAYYSKEFRFVYQVITSPKYLEFGKQYEKNKFERFRKFSEELEKELGISWYLILQWILAYERVVIHYALFENPSILILQKLMLKNMAITLLSKNGIAQYDPSLFDNRFY